MGSWLSSMLQLCESFSLNDSETQNMWWSQVGAEIKKENSSNNENDESEEWMEKTLLFITKYWVFLDNGE